MPDCGIRSSRIYITLVIETQREAIADRIGIREICVKDAVIYLNGTAVKFKGVNRHDSDPVTGFVIGPDQMKKIYR